MADAPFVAAASGSVGGINGWVGWAADQTAGPACTRNVQICLVVQATVFRIAWRFKQCDGTFGSGDPVVKFLPPPRFSTTQPCTFRCCTSQHCASQHLSPPILTHLLPLSPGRAPSPWSKPCGACCSQPCTSLIPPTPFALQVANEVLFLSGDESQA